MAHRYAYRHSVWLASVLLGLMPAVSPAASIFDTDRVLERSNNECVGVPSCSSLQTPALEIQPDQVEIYAVNCPETFPNVWNWDAEQNEHIVVKLVARTDNGLTLSASNQADAPGSVTTYLGCSTEPFEFNEFGSMQSQSGVPTRSRWPQ